MIDKALESIRVQIHQYLKSLPDLNVTSGETVQLTHIVKEDGSIVIPKEAMGLTLVNVEEERHLKEQASVHTSTNGQVVHYNPEIRLNLYVLLAANFNTYSTGLKFLSGVFQFFQGQNVFTPDNSPTLPQEIKKLIVELQTLGFEQQNHLWGYLGAKYLPSAVYKVRLITVQGKVAQDQMPAITEIGVSGSGV